MRVALFVRVSSPRDLGSAFVLWIIRATNVKRLILIGQITRLNERLTLTVASLNFLDRGRRSFNTLCNSNLPTLFVVSPLFSRFQLESRNLKITIEWDEVKTTPFLLRFSSPSSSNVVWLGRWNDRNGERSRVSASTQEWRLSLIPECQQKQKYSSKPRSIPFKSHQEQSEPLPSVSYHYF